MPHSFYAFFSILKGISGGLRPWLSDLGTLLNAKVQSAKEIQSVVKLLILKKKPHTSFWRQPSSEVSQTTLQTPPTQPEPGPHSPGAPEHVVTAWPQARRGSPVRPAGQLHRAWWFTTWGGAIAKGQANNLRWVHTQGLNKCLHPSLRHGFHHVYTIRMVGIWWESNEWINAFPQKSPTPVPILERLSSNTLSIKSPFWFPRSSD